MVPARTVFVTVGATVPFDEMVALVLAPTALDLLHRQGFRRLVVQHGHRDQRKWTALMGGLKESDYRDWTIDGMAYTEDIAGLVQRADLVISHAGTGSILDALRLHRPLVVVVNSKLMDNHQLEVAHEFSKGGYLLYSLVDQTAFESVLNQLPQFRFMSLPDANSSIITSVIDQETTLL